ncbi:MAG: hypothetical protein AB7E95_08365 [Kiritimatiellales bacterium]
MKKTCTAVLTAVLLFAAVFSVDFYFFHSDLTNRLRACHLWRRELWSIGITRSQNPFRLPVPDKPILRARDLTDTAARMVADPFAVQTNGKWYLFFEIDSVSTHQGEIGLSTSLDTVHWDYQGIVLDEPFHLSYPCVVQWQGEWYMIPESRKMNSVRLYKADPFPSHWTFVQTIVEGPHTDSTPVFYNGRWWLFTCTGQNEEMNIFYADDLTGPWTAHPGNPVISGDRTRARCGGRIQLIDGRLIRFAQDCLDRYGHRVLGFEITELTPEAFSEKPLAENPLLEPDGSGWNAARMHQLDLHRTGTDSWIGFIDGNAH